MDNNLIYLRDKQSSGVWENGYGTMSVQTTGTGCYANGTNSVASGKSSYANGESSHTEGRDTIANGNYSHTEGDFNITNGNAEHVEGISNFTGWSKFRIDSFDIENYTIRVIGDITSKISNNDKIYSENYIDGSKSIELTIVSSVYDVFNDKTAIIVNEDLTEANDKQCDNIIVNDKGTSLGGNHVEGFQNTISNNVYGSHAEGAFNQVNGNYGAHAEGYGTSALGESSHSEGIGTIANGNYSHTEGNSTIANGANSHTEGYQTNANGDYSHTEGLYITANDFVEHVGGQYNIIGTGSSASWISTDNLFTLGNGADENNRSNAFQVKKNGQVISGSSIKVGTDSTIAAHSNVGSIRYRSDANNSYCDMVMQTGSSTYAWVIIKQNTW